MFVISSSDIHSMMKFDSDTTDKAISKYNYNSFSAIKPKVNQTNKLFDEKNLIIENHSYLKFYPLQILINRYSFSFEKIYSNAYSFEIQPKYILKSNPTNGFTNNFMPNIAFLNEGFEMLFGLNKIKIRNEKYSAISNGIYLSFRYQHVSNEKYWSGGMSGSSYHKLYRLSQTKNMIGIFYKLSNFYLNKSSIDTYLMLGMYVGHSKTTVFSVKNDNSQNTETNNPVNLIKPNGIFILPQIKIGIIPKFKLN